MITKYCPFCGSGDIRFGPGKVPRCMSCRTVFMVSYARKLRKRPARPPVTPPTVWDKKWEKLIKYTTLAYGIK